MNRASLLHILDHAGGISEAEVRELEQLAAAFPYCQTAHLLLAKAAHDRGSMLAGQRLRRAATYAADRELLRALIERPAPEVAPAATASVSLAATSAPEVSAAEPVAAPAEPMAEAVASSAPEAAAAAVIVPAEAVVAPAEPVADAVALETPAPTETPELAASDIELPVAADAPVEAAEATADEPVSEATEATPEAAEAMQPIEADSETLAPAEAADAEVAAEAVADADAETVTESAAESETSFQTEAETSAADTYSAEAPANQQQTPEPAAPLSETSEPEAAETSASAESVRQEAESEPADAEPITEAAEAVEASVEYEAADAPAAVAEAAPVEAEAPAEPEVASQAVEATEPEVATAETPAEESAEISSETTVLAGTALPATVAAALPIISAAVSVEATNELPPAAPPIRPPVEAGSSRFEFGLGEAPEPLPAYQLPELPEEEPTTPAGFPPFRADELLAYALSSGSRLGSALTLRTPELTTDLPLEAAWPADAATLAHQAAHRPVPPPAPSSLALIDKFLRSQPRIKNAQRPTPTDSPQADLSVRSTSAPPSLASESLAKIMVKQGKIGRAIEIYQQLMLRQPEKKAYFAAQIDLLNQPLE